MAEPASVHRQGHEQGLRSRFLERPAEGRDGLEHEPARRLGCGIYKALGAEIILRQVVVDHHLGDCQRTQEIPEITQLIPGARVQHNDQVRVAELLTRERKLLEVPLRIEKVVARRELAGHRHSRRLAVALQHVGEG